MPNATYNKAIDYFGLVSSALKLKSSAENRSIQTASGANTYGDVKVVDAYGETAAPSAEYDVVAELAHDPSAAGTTLVTLGTVNSPTGIANPVVLGSLSISTQNGSAPSISASGQMVQSGATQLRAYKLPAFTLSPRHRAQDFLSLITSIKKGSGTLTAADPGVDYGLESVNGQFPIEFTLAQPKGVLKTYDLHGGMATVDFTMNWYASGEPTIAIASTVTLRTSSANTNNTSTVNTTVSNPVGKACPEGGYTQYTWQVSFPLIGYEVAA